MADKSNLKKSFALKIILITLLNILLVSCGNENVPVTTSATSNTSNTANSSSPVIVSPFGSSGVSTATPDTIPTITTVTLNSPQASQIALTATNVAVSPAPTQIKTNQEAQAYLLEALDYIEKNSVKRDKLDWQILRQEAFQLARNAKTPLETYPAIKQILKRLGDNHSFFIEAKISQVVAEAPYDISKLPQPQGHTLDSSIGYILIPGFNPNPKTDQTIRDSASQFASLVQAQIRQADQPLKCAWIVDLRQETGGGMFGPFAGLGPILGEGKAGSFVGPQTGDWVYRNGQAWLGAELTAHVDNPYQLKKPDISVAVLTGKKTASAGEALVVAFRGKANTRSFGEATFGVPTSNESKILKDGAVIVLTQALDADRTGQIYDKAISPDQLVKTDEKLQFTDQDPVIKAAASWLVSQPGCAK